MLDPRFIYLGAAINLAGSSVYIVHTLKGRTRPNRVSFFMWALASMVAFAGELRQGVGLPALMTFTAGFVPLLIFLASFVNKQAAWKLTRFDFGCGALSLLGLTLWLATGKGNIAILFAILADGLAAIPTIRKSYTHPETESWIGYFAGGINGLVALLVIPRWTFANYGFPLYITIICAIISYLVAFRPGQQRKRA